MLLTTFVNNFVFLNVINNLETILQQTTYKNDLL